MITRCAILNTTGTDRTANLYLVTSGGTATAINQILKAKEVDANMQEPYLVAGAERQILEAGGTIRGSATAASAVNAVISGILITTS